MEPAKPTPAQTLKAFFFMTLGSALVFALEQFDLESIAALAGQYPGRMLFSPGDAPALTLKLRRSDDPLRTAAQAVERYAALLAPKS